jgi:type I restriction enzyme S subunit
VYQLATGDIRFNISQESLANIEIEIPDTPTQCQIAQILTSLDDKIELNLQMNQTLEAMAQTIFKEWFVDFNFPGFDGELVEGVPKGWRKEPIDQSIDFLNGLALQNFPALNEFDYLPVVKIRELRQGITNSSDKASTEIPEKYIVNDGDVLFSWSGSLDVVLWCNGKGALNQHLFKVSSDVFPKWFYFYWVKNYLPFYQSIAEGKATTMGHIQRKHLTETIINIPDEHIMQKANKILVRLLDKIQENSVQIQTLAQVRDGLLPKLMSGKIKIEEI